MLSPTTLPVERCAALHKPKAKWPKEEDDILMQSIEKHGPSNWNSLACALPGRTGKQCRERWISKLSPNFTADPWTPGEDKMLIALQQERGNQWAKFRSFLPGRSTISIKNRWVSIKRKAARLGPIIPESLNLRVAASPAIDPQPAVTTAATEEDTFGMGFDDHFFGDFDWTA
jgi:hypothetical protein